MHVLAALQPNGLQLASFWPDLLPSADHDSGVLLAREDWRCIRCCTPYESLRHAQRHTTPCCTAARHGMALHVTGLAWHGMALYGIARHGMARHGIAWQGRAGQGRAGMSRLCHANAKREAHCSASALQLPSLYVGVCWCHAHVRSPLSVLNCLRADRQASAATLCCCALRCPLAYGGMPSLLASSERQRLLCSIDAALRRVCARTSGSCVGPARAPAQARTLPRRQ